MVCRKLERMVAMVVRTRIRTSRKAETANGDYGLAGKISELAGVFVEHAFRADRHDPSKPISDHMSGKFQKSDCGTLYGVIVSDDRQANVKILKKLP
jgi:hypothetical protein